MKELNSQQQEAVNTTQGPLLVLAGAGSGKTRVVTARIVKLIEMGCDPSKILGLTFTNKAAREMQERVEKLTHHRVMISTFHSLGAYILRQSIEALGYRKDFTIYDEEDVNKLLKVCLSDLNIADPKEVKVFRKMISHAKNHLTPPSEVDVSELHSPSEKRFPDVYTYYRTKQSEYNAVDFDDLLFLTVRLFHARPDILEHYQQRWSYLLIDEYQDTNVAQYTMVHELVKKSRNLCVVGDPDQAIYSWRGANIRNILNFEEDYPGAKVVHLEHNYRSCSNILNGANALIGHNHNRYEKKLWCTLGAGEKINRCTFADEYAEARFVAKKALHHHEKEDISFDEMTIFYRTNFQSRTFEDALLKQRIPYVIVGGVSFYQRREIKDILAFLRIMQSGTDFVSFARTINLPKRGIGTATLEKIRIGAAQEKKPLLDYCLAAVEGKTQLAPP